jgi:hypothetical protein
MVSPSRRQLDDCRRTRPRISKIAGKSHFFALGSQKALLRGD